MKLFCLFDRLAAKRTNILEYQNVECLRRGLAIYIENAPDSLFAKNPEDYDVFCVGYLAEDSGMVSAECSECFGNLKDFLKGENK